MAKVTSDLLGQVTSVCCKENQFVAKDQTILHITTDGSNVEFIKSPIDGILQTLHISIGESIKSSGYSYLISNIILNSNY